MMTKKLVLLLLLLGVNRLATAQGEFTQAAFNNLKISLLSPLVTMQQLAQIGLSVAGMHALLKAGALLGKIARCEFGCEHHIIDRAINDHFDDDDDDDIF